MEQIVNEKIYYLYRHIRDDKNEVFYVGVGTVNSKGNTLKKCFDRAFSFHKNNPIWARVKKKTTVTVEILLVSTSSSFIDEKEKEFIKIYGKKRDGGTLANICDGGRVSRRGLKHSIESKSNISQKNKKAWENKYREEAKGVFVYSQDGDFIKMFNSIRDCAEELKMTRQIIQLCLNHQINNPRYPFFSPKEISKEDFQKEKENRTTYGIKIKKYSKIIQTDLNGNIQKVWIGLRSLIKPYTKGGVAKALNYHGKVYQNSKWFIDNS